jgi:hypothetical protein
MGNGETKHEACSEGTTPPKDAKCTLEASGSEVYQNTTDHALDVTFQVTNRGKCPVKVGTPSDQSKTPYPGTITSPGKTVTYTKTLEKKKSEDANKHATDVLEAHCDSGKDGPCDYVVKVICVAR